MKTNRLGGAVLSAMLVVTLAGCAGSHQEAKLAANQRWNATRAKILVSHGQDQFTAGDLDDAYRTSVKALSLSPDDPAALELAARVCIDQGKYVTAEGHLQAMMRQDSGTPRTVYLLGVIRDRRERFSEALELYQRAAAMDPQNPAYVLAAAEMLVKLNRPADALALVEGRLERMDPIVGMYTAAGDLAMLLDDPARAAGHYNEARYLAPADLDITAKAAKASFFAERFEEAAVLLEHLAASTEYRDQAWLWSMLGHNHLGRGRPVKAVGCFEKLTKLDPDRARNWTFLATAAAQCGDLPRTAAAARRAMRLAPGEADAGILLGHALLKQDRPNEAFKVLTETARRHPQLAVVHCLLGQSHEALGRKEQAQGCYRMALEIEPGNPVARRLLSQEG